MVTVDLLCDQFPEQNMHWLSTLQDKGCHFEFGTPAKKRISTVRHEKSRPESAFSDNGTTELLTLMES